MWRSLLPGFVALTGWAVCADPHRPRVLLCGAGLLTPQVVAVLFRVRHNPRWPCAPAKPATPPAA